MRHGIALGLDDQLKAQTAAPLGLPHESGQQTDVWGLKLWIWDLGFTDTNHSNDLTHTDGKKGDQGNHGCKQDWWGSWAFWALWALWDLGDLGDA